MNPKYLEWLKSEIAQNGPMKVKTRDDRDAKIYAINGWLEEPIIGRIGNERMPYSWRADGRYYRGQDNHKDIILPPMPSQTKEYWVNVYPNMAGEPLCFHNNRARATEAGAPTRIALRCLSVCQNTGRVTDITDEVP